MRDTAKVAPQEAERLAALSRYEILDTPPEAAFDHITKLASSLLGAPISLISLVADERQWFKSCYGFYIEQTDRDESFCALAIQADTVTEIPDATRDARFATHPLVTGAPAIRFYAGAPLRTPDGFILGTLCVLDTKPRPRLTPDQLSALESLASLVMDELELRREANALREREARLRAIIKGNSDAVYLKDSGGRYLLINPAGASVLGRQEREIIGQRDGDLLGSEEGVRIAAVDQQVLATGAPLSYEHSLQVGSEARILLTSKYPYQNAEGETVGVIGVSRDVTERRRMERLLAEREERYRTVAETASDAIITIDEQSQILYLNPAASTIFGHHHDEMFGKPLTMLMPEHLRHIHEAAVARYSQTGRRHVDWSGVELPGLHRDGHQLALEVSFGEHLQDGHRLFTAIVRDVTERKNTQEALERAHALLRATFDSTAEGVLSVDERGRITSFNQRYLEMWRVPDEMIALGDDNTLVQHALSQLKRPDGFLGQVRAAYQHAQETLDEFELRDGRIIERVSLPQRTGDRIIGRVWSFRDVTARRRAEAHLHELNQALETRVEERTAALEEANRELARLNSHLLYSAFHDSLTDLPNRALFMNRLREAIERCNSDGCKRETDYGFAVLFLDFDRFKIVNDSLGHAVGDQLLIALGERLARCVRPSDTVARLGGDEFTILLENLPSLEEATGTAERIQRELVKPFVLEGHTVHGSASIGVVSGGHGYRAPGDILRDADIAMYRAKALGKSGYQVFTVEMRERAMTLMTLENDLRTSLEHQQLRVHYQPIVALADGHVVGFEALLRWQHPELGLLSPPDFIPLAEETGLIHELDRWVLCEACRQVRSWQEQFERSLTLSVNLSGSRFVHADLIKEVEACLVQTGLPPGDLKLELTESVLAQPTAAVVRSLGRLKRLGVQLYVDDFGTGYSSLSYLQGFPLDALKLDRSFTQKMTVSPEGGELVKTIFVMAQNLGLQVVAEGVETDEQVERLKDLGCTYAQGYRFSRPLAHDTVSPFLRAHFQEGER